MKSLLIARWWITGALFLLILVGLAACGQVYEAPKKPKAKPPVQRQKYHDTLRVLARNRYFDPSVLEEFEQSFGGDIILALYRNNAEAAEKLQSGEAYDLVCLSGSLLARVIQAHGLAELNHTNLNTFPRLDHLFEKSPYDPKHQFSIPYTWRTVGIGYDFTHESQIPGSWGDLLDPAVFAKEDATLLKGRISMFDEGRYVLGCALIYLGFSPNSVQPQELQQARELLKKQRPFVASFDDENARKYLAHEEAYIGMDWSSDVALAREANMKIRFAIPGEGALIFIDFLAVPRNSKRKQMAESFIDFLLAPAVAGRISNFSHCASAYVQAKPFINRELINGPSYQLPSEPDRQFVDLVDPAMQALYERIWAEIKAGNFQD